MSVDPRPLLPTQPNASDGRGASEGLAVPIELPQDMLDDLARRIAELVTMTPFPPLIDAGGAGRLLSVPKSWVLAEARAGRIPHVPLGRYVRFEPEALRDWWQARQRGPVAGSHPVSDCRRAG